MRAELAAGVPIDDGDRYGASALFKAAAAGHLEIGEPLMASPAISEGTLYLRTPSHLYALRAGPSSTGRPAGD